VAVLEEEIIQPTSDNNNFRISTYRYNSDLCVCYVWIWKSKFIGFKSRLVFVVMYEKKE